MGLSLIEDVTLVSLRNELGNLTHLVESYFDGFYTLYEFKVDDFEDVYQIIQAHLGDRDDFSRDRLETRWVRKAESYDKVTIKLYQDLLEIFIDLPTSIEELSDVARTGLFDYTKPEQLEYLQRRKELQLKHEMLREAISEEQKREEILKLNALRVRRIIEDQAFRAQRRSQIEEKIAELQGEQAEEKRRIEELAELKSREEQLFQEQQELKRLKEERAKADAAAQEAKRRRESYDTRIRQEVAERTLPKGDDYNASFYRRQLDILRSKYGQDSEIDDLMHKEGNSLALLNKKEYERAYAKWYVEYYKVKYEGVSILQNFNEPKTVLLTFDEYVRQKQSKDTNSNILIWVIVLFFVLIALLAGGI